MLKNITKKLDDNIVKLCEHFAEKCYLTNISKYQRRNQFDPLKIKNDIFVGKMAEFAIYFIFLDRGIKDISIPDLKVYDKRFKSFDADLKTEKINLHIKTQDLQSSLKYGISWVFQKEDSLVKNPKDNDYFIGTQFDNNTFEVKIMLPKYVKNLKFDEPRLKKLSSKTCVYLDNNR
jgi:hypothetical protein